MSRVSLSCLVVLAACLAGTVTADLQPGSLWHVINSRSDLSLAAAAISYHPDLVLFLSNPETKITMLLPNDKAMAAALDANNKWETIRKNIRANDVLFPSSQVLSNAATVRKQMWMVLNYHILKQGIEINSKLLVPGDYPTALALEGQDNYLTVFRKAGSTYITDMDQSVEAKVVEADLQAGRSVLHIIDAVLFPDTAPARAFPKISDAVGTIFANLMRNASSELFYDFSPVPLTIFSPSDGAINDWAKGQGLTLDALYKNTGMSAQLVRAHAIQGQALYANDLLALAAAKRFGLKSADGAEFMTGVTARKNPNGNWLQVQTSWDGVTAGDIMIGFSDARVGAQATSMGVIRGVAGIGGSEAGSDVVSVVYAVDKVLL